MSYFSAMAINGSYTKEWQFYGFGTHPGGATISYTYSAIDITDAYNDLQASYPASGRNLGDVAYLLGEMQTWVFICGNDALHDVSLNSSSVNKVNFNGTLYFDSILTVTFNKQGGTGGTDSVTVNYDGTLTSGSAPTRSGYTFQGYYTSTNGGGTKYYDSNMYGLRTVDFK